MFEQYDTVTNKVLVVLIWVVMGALSIAAIIVLTQDLWEYMHHRPAVSCIVAFIAGYVTKEARG